MKSHPSPKWLLIGDEIRVPLLQKVLSDLIPSSVHLSDVEHVPYLAAVHFFQCLGASDDSNRRGHHSVSMCLLRQCVEAATIIDCGLQDKAFSEPLLRAWAEDKKTVGEIRKDLEKYVWCRYGRGLWLEPWAEFYGRLARAVQPYAHYSPSLMGWQFAMTTHEWGTKAVALLGTNTYDPVRASRITLLMEIVHWSLGRLFLENGRILAACDLSKQIGRLGTELGRSKLLFKTKDWEMEMMPHMSFRPGYDWQDD